ncbi:hypothetical protein ACQJBY_005524 [Aegilops geniculata]
MASPPRAAAVNQRGAAARTTSCILAANEGDEAPHAPPWRCNLALGGARLRRNTQAGGRPLVFVLPAMRYGARRRPSVLQRSNASTTVGCDATTRPRPPCCVGTVVGAAMQPRRLLVLQSAAAELQWSARPCLPCASMQRTRDEFPGPLMARCSVSGGVAELQCNGMMLCAGPAELQFNTPVGVRSCSATAWCCAPERRSCSSTFRWAGGAAMQRGVMMRAGRWSCNATWAPLRHTELAGGGAAMQRGRGCDTWILPAAEL